MAVIRTERGLDRLVNFADATVAIAITLLILPLVDVAGDIAHESVGTFVSEHNGELLGFVISFIVIGRFWIIHHRVFELVLDYSPAIIWYNFLWLASIVFIPFATNLVSAIGGDRGDVDAVYIGNMVVASVAMLLIEQHLYRHPELLKENARDSIDLLRGLTPALLLVVALVLAVLVPQVGLFWLLVLFLGRPLHALLVLVFRPRGSQSGR